MKKHLHEYFSTPLFLEMDAFGIDISDNYIYYGEVKKSSKGNSFKNFGHEALPDGVIVDGEIIKENELLLILKRLKKKLNLHYVRISLPNSPEGVVNKYLSIFKRAKIIPLSFECQIQSISRAVIQKGDISSRIILNFSESKISMGIVEGGQVLFDTDINIDDVSLLSTEINKHYINWKINNGKQLTHKKIDQIILCGKNSTLEGLASFIEEGMKMKVVYANVWVNVFDATDSIHEISYEESLNYASVVGLSLRNFHDDHEFSLNILPQKQKKLINFKYKLRLTVIVLNLLALVAVIATLLLVPSYFLSKLKVDLAENKLESMNSSADGKVESKTINAIKDINSKLLILTKDQQSSLMNSDILDEILSKKVKGVSYTEIILNRNNDNGFDLEVHGTFANKTILENYRSSLDDDLNFSSINILILEVPNSTELNFTATMQIL